MNEAIPIVWNPLHGGNFKIEATSLGLEIYQSKCYKYDSGTNYH